MDFWIILIVVFVLFIIYYFLNPKVPNGLKDVHTVTTLSTLKAAVTNSLGSDRLYLTNQSYLDNDGLIKFQIRGKWFCLISDPVLAKDIFLRPDVFPKLQLDEYLPDTALSHHYGVNVVHSNGDVWKRQRRICNLAFKVLPVNLVVETGLKLMDIMEEIDNKPIEVVDLMHRFTLDVLGKVVFDLDFNNLGDPTNVYVTTYNEVQEELKSVIFTILPLDRIPYFKNKRIRKVEKLEKLFDDMIEKKHKSIAAGRSNGDLLELMIKACNDQDNQENPSLTDLELRHNLAIFMIAGHDTTANALATLLYILSVHKDVQQKAREEILRILGDNLTPSAEQHKLLKYLNMIIHENLRLYPPVPMLPFRKVTEDLKYKNHVIPAGTGIALFIYGIQHSPKLWENPEKFVPERFENEHFASGNDSWLAFGGGSRMCLGNNLSLIEQRIALCLILRKYEILLPPNSIHKDRVREKGHGTPQPIELVFKRRAE
ncbi:8683_t:CDS:10 [Cetraspora pellucida]|uniref:8683_t:CDS:1 n=1 Tax=Cetraspora pellucida TaxID=1433469 RepID=A0A9N9P0Y7_9GLOM|nr:8683_t:CDS:10 [Cetraspora pellucida]